MAASLGRRDLAALLGGAAAWPVAAGAQPAPRAGTRRVGLLTPSNAAGRRAPLLQALAAHGYREGANLALETRSAEGRLERLPALAQELIAAGVEVIVAVNTPGTQAAIASGTRIPIVMALVGDPVGSGFVPSLGRPGGTVTGASNSAGEIAEKRLALLKEALPGARRIAVFTHPDDPVGAVQLRQIAAAAGPLGVEFKVFDVVASRADLERAVADAVAWRADAVFRVLAQTAPELSKFQAELLLGHRLPAMVGTPEEVENGGLMTYFADVAEHWANVALYVDLILKGANPGELPVRRPTKFRLVINLTTARALDLTFPPAILAFAEVVE